MIRDPRRSAIVFAPVQAKFDGGGFFGPITKSLEAHNFSVEFVDTLARCGDDVENLDQLSDVWQEALPGLGSADIVCGNALGGALAQVVAHDIGSETPMLLVSAPTRSDRTLSDRLGQVVQLADGGQLHEAIDLLEMLVLPRGTARSPGFVPPDFDDPQDAARRIARGFGLLVDIDVSAAVLNHHGPVLSIVGAQSQLVTAWHAVTPNPEQLKIIPGTGMRPHTEQAVLVTALVNEFLDEMENR